jgi:transposase
VEVAPPKARHVVRKGARRGGMEISLPNGARVAIDADVDAGALRLVLAALGDL